MQRFAIFSLALAFAATFSAGEARASAEYPAAIRDKAQLMYTPACTLCHAEIDGSDGVIATDFARTLWALGMRGRSVLSLEIALDKVRARRWDTDGDGVTDIDELIASRDPSGPALSNDPGPEHGCSIASLDGLGARDIVAPYALFAATFVASRLRRRRATRSPSQFRRPE